MRLVFVGGSWCVPCKKFLPVVEGVAQTLGVPLDVYAVDGKPQPRPPVELGPVTQVPTVLVVRPDGRVARKLSGGQMTPGDLLRWVREGGL